LAGETMSVEPDTRRGATVLVDATSLNRHMKGVGRYAWHLCEALSRGLPAEAELVLVVFAGELPDFPAGFRGRWLRLPYYSGFRLGLREFPRLIRETGASVFIRPADKIGRRYPVPTLTVCHDLNRLIWAAQPPRPWRRKILGRLWEFFCGRALRQSDRVICNSEFTRTAVVRHFGLSRSRTSVGYCGVDRRIPELAKTTAPEAVQKKMGTDHFLLAFATGDEREGFGILPELWSAARRAGYPGKLVVAGVKEGAGYADELRQGFQWAGQPDTVIYLPFLGEEKIAELAGLYGAADFYLETSRHEGFGMQLVEAMACGTTCFSSGRGALDEIGGGFPLALDIESPSKAGHAVAAAWRAGMHRRNNSAQETHALTFDWQNTCDQVVRFAIDNLRRSRRAGISR
jgi:glycosyltransferase involved in cell wall biosynthesis